MSSPDDAIDPESPDTKEGTMHVHTTVRAAAGVRMDDNGG